MLCENGRTFHRSATFTQGENSPDVKGSAPNLEQGEPLFKVAEVCPACGTERPFGPEEVIDPDGVSFFYVECRRCHHMWVLPTDVKNYRQLDASVDTSTHGRYFDTGAYRDTDEGKPDYEGYLSPLVLQAYGAYMLEHQRQSDGQMRGSDNWQAGIPREQYMKSLLRHVHDLWMEHRGYESRDGVDEALGGLLFNAMGFWFELLKERRMKS